jgi:hypothetical protein
LTIGINIDAYASQSGSGSNTVYTVPSGKLLKLTASSLAGSGGTTVASLQVNGTTHLIGTTTASVDSFVTSRNYVPTHLVDENDIITVNVSGSGLVAYGTITGVLISK